jgi:hypothetical protein
MSLSKAAFTQLSMLAEVKMASLVMDLSGKTTSKAALRAR